MALQLRLSLVQLSLSKRSQLHPEVTGLITLGYPRGQLAGPSRKVLPSRPGCQVKMTVVIQSHPLPHLPHPYLPSGPSSFLGKAPSPSSDQSVMARGCGSQVDHPKPAGTISQEGVGLGMNLWAGLEIQSLGSQHRPDLLTALTGECPCSAGVSLRSLLLQGEDSSHEFPGRAGLSPPLSGVSLQAG